MIAEAGISSKDTGGKTLKHSENWRVGDLGELVICIHHVRKSLIHQFVSASLNMAQCLSEERGLLAV